jgi:uncharacterized membrane protein
VIFANPLPAWAIAAVVAAAAAVAWLAYRRVPITAARRAGLSALRFVTLIWIAICLMRPMVSALDPDGHDAVVAVLVDGSRSMGLADLDGARRIDGARGIVTADLLPALAPRFRTEVLRFGERLAPTDAANLSATDRRTELGAALQAVRDRYRGRPVAGVILLSDGGDNGAVDAAAMAAAGAPIYAVGIGPRTAARDREIVSVTAADSVLSDAMVDLAVTAVAHGYGAAPIELRLLENGRAIDHRRVTPAAPGAPISETFRVGPNRDVPTVYRVEIPGSADEPVAENNARSVLVPAAGRPRRVLLVQGAPGFEHSFLRRAWAADRGLEIDSVVRKGRDDSGAETFYVQAAQSRANALLGGYPNTREALFAYDAIVLANVDPDLLTNGQLELTRGFVAERGGGLLVLGARGFQRQGLNDTPLEDVMPLDSSDRGAGGVVQVAASPGRNRVVLTPAGESHPVMQLGTDAETNDRRWAAVPPLAAISPLGTPKPGASVLAVTGGPGGAPRALVAVQRFGEGRSMVFTGEASWRWRMLLPTSDQSYERFWRQAARWLVQNAPTPVQMTLPAAPAPGDAVSSGRERHGTRDLAGRPRRHGTRHRDPWPSGAFSGGDSRAGIGRLSRCRRGAPWSGCAGRVIGDDARRRRRSRDDRSAIERRHPSAGGACLRGGRSRGRRYRGASRASRRRTAGGRRRGASRSVAHGMVVRAPGRVVGSGMAGPASIGAAVARERCKGC